MTQASFRSPMSDADIEALQARNALRAEEAKKALGRAYLLHPSNKVGPVKQPRRGLLHPSNKVGPVKQPRRGLLAPAKEGH